MNPGATPASSLAPGRGVGNPTPTPRSLIAAYVLLGLFLAGGVVSYAAIAIWVLQ